MFKASYAQTFVIESIGPRPGSGSLLALLRESRALPTAQKSIAALFRLTDNIWGRVPSMNLDVVIRTPPRNFWGSGYDSLTQTSLDC
jgi:hypothetical protein